MVERRRLDWPAVRMAYEETDETIADIAVRFGTFPASIAFRGKREGWRPRDPVLAEKRRQTAAAARPPPDLAALVASLQRTTARLVSMMESRVATEGEGVSEQDVRALGALAATLQKVISLEPPKGSRHADLADPPDDDARTDDRDMLEEFLERARRFVQARQARPLPGEPAAADADLAAELLADGGPAGPDPAAG